MFVLEIGRYLKASFSDAALGVVGSIEVTPYDELTAALGTTSKLKIDIDVTRNGQKSDKSLSLTLVCNPVSDSYAFDNEETFGDIDINLKITIVKTQGRLYNMEVKPLAIAGSRTFSSDEYTKLTELYAKMCDFLHYVDYTKETASQFADEEKRICMNLNSSINFIYSIISKRFCKDDDTMEVPTMGLSGIVCMPEKSE